MPPKTPTDKVHNPQAEFAKPTDVVRDSTLSKTEKKKALENWEEDAQQLMTASDEGMTPADGHLEAKEPKLDGVIKAKEKIGLAPIHKTRQ